MVSKNYLTVLQTIDPDQMPYFAASDLGLHCLLRPVCPNSRVILVNICKIWQDKTLTKQHRYTVITLSIGIDRPLQTV